MKNCVALKRAVFVLETKCLTAESVQSPALSLQSVDDVHGSDGLPLGVLCVCHGIADHVLKENLKDATGLLVDESGDSLHTTTTSETTDSGLGNTLDVVTQNFAMTLRASLSQSLSSFATSRHSYVSIRVILKNVSEI
jgi:hypothetical protein